MKKNILLFLLAVTLFSCSKGPEGVDNEKFGDLGEVGGITGGYAPSNVVGKEFRFYKIEDSEFKLKFKVLPAQNPSNAKISFDSQYVLISTPYFYYEKTGKNVADVLCSFYYQLLGIIGFDNIFDYTLELTFLSNNHGTYKGELTHYESSNDWTDVQGYFVFNTNKEPNELFNVSELPKDEISPGSANDLAKIVGKWSEDVDKTQNGWSLKQTYYSFDEDGNYSCYYGIGVILHDGTYKIKGNSIEIKVVHGFNDKPVGSKHQLKLSNGKLIDGGKTYSKMS